MMADETLTVQLDFEAARVAFAAARGDRALRSFPVADPSGVLAWARRHASSVRKLFVFGGGWGRNGEALVARLVEVVGPHLTDVFVSSNGELCAGPSFWEALRDHVVPAGRLRSFIVKDCVDFGCSSSGPGVEALGQLAGSLEELVFLIEKDESLLSRGLSLFRGPSAAGLPRFPEFVFALKKLRRLAVRGHPRIKEVPAGISSLQNLKELDLCNCDLTSLPKELGELAGLEELMISSDENLGNVLPEAAAFPAELAGMTSLRGLHLHLAGLRAVPALIAELKSLESLTLCCNHFTSVPRELGGLSKLTKLVLSTNKLGGAAAALPAELGNMKSLRELYLEGCGLRTFPSAFVGGLADKSLELLDLRFNNFEVDAAALAALLKHCGRRLREVRLSRCLMKPNSFASPWTAESLANLRAFKARLLAENPGAKVTFDFKDVYGPSV